MSWDTWEAFFDLSKRVIKGAPRADIHENLRHLFSMFLEAFDLCSSQLVGTFEFDKHKLTFL